MAEVYVTLSEAAELEGVQYQTMARRTQRNKKNFVTKTEKSETGGRDVVLVAVSSLSKQARNAWKEREKLKSFTEEFPDKKEDEQKPEVPWYVNTDVDWYIENYKERYYKAVELGNVVRKLMERYSVRRCPVWQMQYHPECQQLRTMQAHSSPICRLHISQAAEA